MVSTDLASVIAEYADVAKRIEKEAVDLDESGRWENDGSDARANLSSLAEGISLEAAKFSLLFGGAKPTHQEMTEILRDHWLLVQKFVAWCHAVSTEGPAIKREVTLAGRTVLVALRNLLQHLVESQMQQAPSNEMVGAVMKGSEMFKRLSKSPQAAVQKQLLRDAAGVKTMVDDVSEMIESNKDADKAAGKMGDMQLEGSQSAQDRDDEEWDAMMNMDVNLSPAELKVAEASVAIARSCMAVLKTGVKILVASEPAGVDESAVRPGRTQVRNQTRSLDWTDEGPRGQELEALSAASTRFSVACEDLGALTVLDQGACAGCAATIVDSVSEGVPCLVALAARREGAKKHAEDAQEALESARAALKDIP